MSSSTTFDDQGFHSNVRDYRGTLEAGDHGVSPGISASEMNGSWRRNLLERGRRRD